jgi:hypothetical protein
MEDYFKPNIFFRFVTVFERQRFCIYVSLYYCDYLKGISYYEFVEVRTVEAQLTHSGNKLFQFLKKNTISII